MTGNPSVSVVVPARNEADYLPATLRSVRAVADGPREVIVVDGGSTDGTRDIAADAGARVVEQPGEGIGDARHRGALRAEGEWVAFIDADTVLRPDYLRRMRAHVAETGQRAASSRCLVRGCRGKAMQLTVNHAFPRLDRPVLPGFNFFVERETYVASGGFPNVPNEDTAFSRRLGRAVSTGYCPEVLVETSGRRFREQGLTGALVHYLVLDWRRWRTAYP